MFAEKKKGFIFATANKARARSSVGSEHLVYTQGVRGSNPFAPTLIEKSTLKDVDFFVSKGHELARWTVETKKHNAIGRCRFCTCRSGFALGCLAQLKNPGD